MTILPILMFSLGLQPAHAGTLPESGFERPAEPTLVQALGTLSSFIESPDGELTPDLLKSYCFLHFNGTRQTAVLSQDEIRMRDAFGEVLRKQGAWSVRPSAALANRTDWVAAQKAAVLHRLHRSLLALDPEWRSILAACAKEMRSIRNNQFLARSLEYPLVQAEREAESRERVAAAADPEPWQAPTQDNLTGTLSVPPARILEQLPSILDRYHRQPEERVRLHLALKAAGVELPPDYKSFKPALPPLASLEFTRPEAAGLLNVIRDRAEQGTLGDIFNALNLTGPMTLRVLKGLPAIELRNPAPGADTLAALDWGTSQGRTELRRHAPDDMRLASFLQFPVLDQFAVRQFASLLPGIEPLFRSESPRAINRAEEAYLWLLALGYDVDSAAADHGFFRPAGEERLLNSFRREILADRPLHFPLPDGAQPSDQAMEAAWRAYRKAAAALTALPRQEDGSLELSAIGLGTPVTRWSRDAALVAFEGALIRGEIHRAVLHVRDALDMVYSATDNQWAPPQAPLAQPDTPRRVRPGVGSMLRAFFAGLSRGARRVMHVILHTPL